MDEQVARISHKLATYVPHVGIVNLVQQTSLVLLAGVSGAGKGAIKAELLKTGKYHRIITHTTRQPRINHGTREQHGVDYHFIDLPQAEQMLDGQAFIEAKLYGGNVYGTSVAELRLAQRTGKIAVADIDVRGVADYISLDPNVRTAFILPPDYKTWQARLAGRHGGLASREDIEQRMVAALRELEHALEVNHFHFIINRTLADAAAEAHQLVHSREPSVNTVEARKIAEELYGGLRAELAV